MCTKGRMNKHIMIYSPNGILNNDNTQTTAKPKHMNESHKQNVEQKYLDTKDYTLWHFIYVETKKPKLMDGARIRSQ